MTTEKQEMDDFWALVSLFGHNQIAGRVSTYSLGGASFILVSVPPTTTQQAFSKMFNPSAIYDITPMSEETVRGIAESLKKAPMPVWDIREQINLLALNTSEGEEKHNW